MNLKWKDFAVIAGLVLVMVIVATFTYNTGTKMLGKKKPTLLT
ncbi:MAG TPA: hypothetical protein VF691_04165 [Cytophagaceae bacterium]|jgi:hypothetical protein